MRFHIVFSCSFGSIYEAIFFPRCDLSVRTSNKTPEFHGRINHSHNLCGIDIKKRLQCRCFSVNIVKCLRTLFLQNSSGGCFFRELWNMDRFWKRLINRKFNPFKAHVSHLPRHHPTVHPKTENYETFGSWYFGVIPAFVLLT